MTSTNDGSNLRSGQKDKRYYIESFQSLEARLNGPASTEQRTRNVCEAWRLVHGLCSHSTPDTRSHLLSWIQRNTAYAILQDEWGLPENKPKHAELEKAINDFILECHKTDTLLVWESTLLRRAVWYKGVLSNPWGHAVLKALLDPKGVQPTDQEVIEWLREERAMMFVTRVRVMARAKRLFDLALVLVTAVMTRARRAPHTDDQDGTASGVQGCSKGSNFVETLSREAGFTKDVWELLIDIEFVLLHKQDQSTCIDLAKKIPLKDGKRIVERLRFRLEKSPADKKLWKKAKDVAILIAQVVITRCMVVTSCTGAVLDALTGCAGALAQLLDGSRLPQVAAALAAPAATAAHLYAFADAIAHQCKDKVDRQPFICEFYVRAITAGMNELERLKLEKDKEAEVCALQHTLSGWFTQLGEVLSTSARLRCECLLTAFSLHPSAKMYDLVVALPPLTAPDKSPKRDTSEVTSEFGSWATDSRTSSNFVKTSETLNLKQTQKQTNILSSSMFDTECGALGLKSELCEDLAVLLSGPRVKTLSWDMDRETLLENCRVYKERTQEGTRALTTELKYLNLDPKSYDHLPEEEDDEDNYYGIEKGYEVSQEYEDIWSDNNIDYMERSESACSISTVDSTKISIKSKSRKNPAKHYDDEIDPLSFDTEENCNTLESSKISVKKPNEAIKEKSKPKKLEDPDSKKLLSEEEKKLLKKQKRKERRERKKREKMEMLLKQELQIGVDDGTTNLIGTKILSAGVEPAKERRKQKSVKRTQHVSATDSDYDSQGKSSLASINSEGNETNDVLFDGLFSMDEIKSPEKTTCQNLSAAYETDKERIAKQNQEKQDMVTDKLKKLLQLREEKKQNNLLYQSAGVSKYVGNTNSTSNSNIHRPEGVKPQVQGLSPIAYTFKSTELAKLNNMKHSEKFDDKNCSNRKVHVHKSNNVVGQQKFPLFSGTHASGFPILDPHQKQFQEFLKRQNVPITYNERKQNHPSINKVMQTELAQRNPVLTGLIQQKSEVHHNVKSVRDMKEPGCSISIPEAQYLKQQNLPIIETKKHMKPQKHGVNNVPNTFSRLSYMHKNKQADIKYKQSNEQERVKTQISKLVDNDSFLKINNLQKKGEIVICKALQRNNALNRDLPIIRQGDRIPNPSSSAAVPTKDLRLNIVNVSKVTKEIVENQVIIKKDPTTMPVDLRYIIDQTNLDVGTNWKSQYPNTNFGNSAYVPQLNTSDSDKLVVHGVANKNEITNIKSTQSENSNRVIVPQVNNKDESIAPLHKGGEIENSEDWKLVMNKLRSLKSDKKTIDALEMTLKGNSSMKGRAEILNNLHKYATTLKGCQSREHIKVSSKQKIRINVTDTKQTLIKHEKSNHPAIVKKITKKPVTKCSDPNKPLIVSKTLKAGNAVVPLMHNSDYDQLDDLIDDELRQEIEESSPLNAEVDIMYGSARVATPMPVKEEIHKIKSSQVEKSVLLNCANYNKEQTSKQSIECVVNTVTRTCSVIKENKQGSASKPKLHIISDQILLPYRKSSESEAEKYDSKSNISKNRSSVIAELPISFTHKMPNAATVGNNKNNVSIITSPINIVHPANVILRNVSHVNQVKNLMFLSQTNTVLTDSNQATPIIEQQLPMTSNVNKQEAYVLKPQNKYSFSSPQLTMSSIYTDSIKQDYEFRENDMLMMNTEPISQSTTIGQEICVDHTTIKSKIGSGRLNEEVTHSNNQNVKQYCDDILKIPPNQTRNCNKDTINKHITEESLQRFDEISNTKSETELINNNLEIMRLFPKKNEIHENTAHSTLKSVSNQESKYNGSGSKPKTIESESGKIERNSQNITEPKLEEVACKLTHEVKILNEPKVLSNNVETDEDFQNEINEVAKISSTKSNHCNLYQHRIEPLTIYEPQNKILESSIIDNTSDNYCNRNVLSRVQENLSAKIGSEVKDCRIRSENELERLRNKRLSIINREINHHIISEPIALMYAPICFEDNISNDHLNKPICSQNNITGKAEQRLKLDNISDDTTSKATSAEESSVNSGLFISKNSHIPTRRLRSSNSFRISKCTTPDESELSLRNSVQQSNVSDIMEVKKPAPKRISEKDLSTEKSVDKIQNSAADSNTIDLTDTEPTNDIDSLEIVSGSGLLNKNSMTIVKNAISLERPVENEAKQKRSVEKINHSPVRKLPQGISETNFEKEISVTEIREIPMPKGDNSKKILRVKLSNGNIFRATVSGNLKVNIKTILSEPSIKSLLTTNILQRKSCTVNVKHITDYKNDTTKNEVTISNVFKKPDLVHTEVIELSDDEDDNIYYFKTEFGTYKTKLIDSKAFEKHQHKFSQKCTVKLENNIKSLHNNVQDEDSSEVKICDVTNECVNIIDEVADYPQTINVMEESELNSKIPNSKTENLPDTLKNLQTTLMKSQVVQLHNVCRVNLERCDQQLNSHDCCNTVNEESNIATKRSHSFSLLTNIENLDGNILESECSLAESQVKHDIFIPSLDKNYCDSDILCTKSTMHRLEAKIMQQNDLKSDDSREETRNSEENETTNFNTFTNILRIETNSKITPRPESPSIIADFESETEQSSNSRYFDQSICNSDWILLTKATIQRLEVNKQRCIKALLDLRVKADLNLDSSTDCESDLDFTDLRPKTEAQKVVFHVPSLLHIVYKLITSNGDILERYIAQKNIKNDAFSSPTHNLKRKYNMSGKRSNSKMSKTDGGTFSCDLNVYSMVVVDKENNNKIKHVSTGEQKHPTFVQTNESNIVKTVGDADSSNNKNNQIYKENISNLEFEITKDEMQIRKLEFNNQGREDAMESINDVPSQMQNIKERRPLESTAIVKTAIEYTKNNIPKFFNEVNHAEYSDSVTPFCMDSSETDYSKNINNKTFSELKMSKEENTKNNNTDEVHISNKNQLKCNNLKPTEVTAIEHPKKGQTEIQDFEKNTQHLSNEKTIIKPVKKRMPNCSYEVNLDKSKADIVSVSCLKVLCDDSNNDDDNRKCEGHNVVDNNILNTNIFDSSQQTDENRDINTVSGNNVVDTMRSIDKDFDLEKNNKHTMKDTVKNISIHNNSNFLQLINVDEKANELNSQYSRCNSQDAIQKAKELYDSGKLTQVDDENEVTITKNMSVNHTKTIVCEETCENVIHGCAKETPQEIVSCKNDLNDSRKITTKYDTHDTEIVVNSNKYDQSEQMVTRNNAIETNTSICNEKDTSNEFNKDQQSLIIYNSEEAKQETNESENELQKMHPQENKITSGILESKNIKENFTENDKIKDINKNSERESVTLIYKGNSSVVLKGSPYVDPVVGTCYIFPLSSSCNSKEFTGLSTTQTINAIQFNSKSTSLKKISINESDNYSFILPKITYSRINDNKPKNLNTRQLKRKCDSKYDCKLEKKYRKGKNIDTCKQTTEIYSKIAYAEQYKRLLEYCTTIKFSYSRPFHKKSIDPTRLLKNWPIQNKNCENYATAPLEESDKCMFIDIDKENKSYFDPLQQTLAEEIAMEYNNTNEYSQCSQIEDSNFYMGFGEGSDRVIQNLTNGIYTSKFSAATLSDVKLPQPSFTTRDRNQNIPQIIKKSNDEELANMKRCISFIQLRDKVKDFFRKSASELHCNLNIKTSRKTILYDLTSPHFFNPPAQMTVVNVVQVGQLPVSASAQNPVTCDPRVTHVSNASPPQCSAENSPDSDQNASKTEYTELTTADLSLPLVQEYQQNTQVIMSSQSQLSVPINSKVSMDINCESKLEHQEEIVTKNENTDVTNNFLSEHKNISSISYSYNAESDSFKSENNSYKSINDSYKSENDTYKPENVHKTDKKTCKPDSNVLQSENSRTLDIESQNAIFDSLLKDDNDYVFKAKTINGASEKTDQIAHAMNAAGITTGTDSISNNNRAHALVNILSQKLRQNTVNTTQTVNSYTKGSPINAMALQQALAQILPPPLNQTNSSDHQNAPITPQVLHIVQGKNTSGNQITIVDNQQNSVINNTNNTPVLHIVQNKSAIGSSAPNSNSSTQNNNSFSGLSLVDAGIQQGGNQLLHIVNTGQKNSTSGQLLKRVNLLTNLTNVQGNNEQKMVQFVCKSADGKSIQLNAPHQRSMVLRLQPIESTNVPNAAKSEGQEMIQSPNFVSTKENNNTQQQEIKSRSVYEENYAKFIQNSSPKPSMPEKSTSLPKFNQAFGKQVYQENNQKNNEIQSNNTSHVSNTNTSTENVECSSNDNTINLEHINQINSPPLLLRKSPAQTSQSQQGQSNLVQQIKQSIAPVNIQTMHGGVIYTRQIPVNIGGGQTINLITVPSTDLIDETGQKQQNEVKFVNQNEIEPSIIKIVPQSQNSSTSEGTSEDNNSINTVNDTPHTTTATHTQPVLTQMRIKLPMLSKTPQMVSGARLVRPSFFQIQRNVIGGANQPVYQQLVLTAAPSLGQQNVRPPQSQPARVKTTTENQTSSESHMSSSTLEQLREFDMVLEQVKERSTVQPNSNTNNTYTKLQSPTETTESNTPASTVTTEPTQQVLYSIGNNNSLNVAYVNRKPAATTPTTSTFARSPDSSGVADSPTSSTHVQIPTHSSSNETSSDTSPQQSQPKPKTSSKSKSRPKTSSNPTTSMKINTVPPKTSTQKPLEDEQTTQRILYILAEYKEQVENSPDKDKPAPRRRSNPPSNPGSSKRKKSSSGSRRPGRDMSPIHGEDTCRTMGSEDSSCGTSQGDCTENCLETHSPQDSPRKVVRKLTFENETPNATPRQQPARNVIVADGQTITVARGTAGKPATAVLMPANYILPVSMVKGGQQIAIVTNRGPKILTVGGEGGGNALLLQRLIGPAGLKPVLARPGVRHVRLPTAALHNLQAFNIAAAANVQPPDSTASPAPAPTPPDLVETRATSSPWPDRDTQDVKPERSSSPEGSEPWNLPSSADPHDYSYEETVRAENLDRTVLDAIPDRYSPDLEAQRIFDKMFDVDTKKSYIDSQDSSPRCGYDIDASDCDDKGYPQVVQKRDQRQHRLAHVSAAALRHKYAILEHELRLQKSLSEECEDLGVDSPSASELFPEAELLFASSPAHESSHHGHTPQPGISQSTIPQPDMDDQIATDQLLNRTLQDDHQDLDVTLGLDEGIVTVSEDGMQATITLDQEEFARSHPNTTFHSEPTEEENVQPYTVSGIKGRHITSTIFHAGRAPATVLMTAPPTTVISQALPDQQHSNIKYIDNIMNPGHNNICLSSVLVKDDGLTKYDNILNDSRELHLSNTASAIVHSNTTQVIRRVCYDDDKRDSRFLLDETDALIAGDDAKMIAEDSSRDATLESIADDRSSPERHTELFWESNSASERSDSRRPLDFSSDSDKCCKSPLYDETNSTDSSGVGAHMRLDSVIKDARGLDRSGSADNSSADDTLPPLRTYPPKRMYHVDGEMERSVSGKTRAGERSPDGHEVRRRASVRGVVKRGCHCCNGSPAPPRPKKSRQKKPSIDFNN